MLLKNLLQRIHLNVRAARLALTGRWLTPDDVAASYDALATVYRDHWLTHLCRTTDRLHEQLPERLPANDSPTILDLGCGSGYSTAFLAQKYPTAGITAVDISAEMLNQAKATLGNPMAAGNAVQRSDRTTQGDPVVVLGGGHGVTALPFPATVSETPGNIRFVQNDMLQELGAWPDRSCDLVFSAWAIGYSVPARIIAEASRVLRPGGTLAVIVNRLGTMPAVFAAFRKTMRAFPASLEKAVWPRFPRSAAEIQSQVNRTPLTLQRLEEGIAPITPPTWTNAPNKRLDWLLGTGVLAGFDSVLPLQPRPENNDHPSNAMRRFFARELDSAATGWEHHYVMFVAKSKSGWSQD
jgi:ubiquinone/menaquinone biosynthesis C-methylase UbiE